MSAGAASRPETRPDLRAAPPVFGPREAGVQEVEARVDPASVERGATAREATVRERRG